jgi:endonuclease/exonuclease/phosphatase family metal-dependent hydrolase
MRLVLLRAALGLVRLVERRPRSTAIALSGALSIGLGAVALSTWPADEHLELATFNIENFPRSSQQAERVFALVAELDVDALAVQEIRDPPLFEQMARERLGPSWRFVFAEGDHPQKVGVLFDGDELVLLGTETHRETMVGGRAKPVFEARLARAGGSVLRFFVVHLASGGEAIDRRRLQLDAIEPVLRRAVDSGEHLAIAGDFNATSESDRESIEAMSIRLGLSWASRDLACTSYWRRRDGCVGAALDHVLVSNPVLDIGARGGCLTDGCSARRECPRYRDEISDHCPIRFVVP